MTTPSDEPDYTSPNGIPDRWLHENEARLWLLSETERRHGDDVAYDGETERWRRTAVEAAGVKCGSCPKIFRPSRIDAKYCSVACRKKASRRANVTLKGRLVSQ